MTILQSTHVVDTDLWDFIKYLLVAFAMVMVWQAKELISLVKTLLIKVEKIEVNSNNTAEKINSIEEKVGQIEETVNTHDKEIYHLKTRIS